MKCEHGTSCKLCLAGLCLYGGIETNGPLSIKESLQCKMIDIDKTAKSSGILIGNANEEVLKAALIMDSEQENCYIIFNRKKMEEMIK